ncbi:MAG: OadG family protein [Kiritimatiellae bacterium]|nr:OadG family protein [Kiritimatiellia bacterium]
MFTQGLTLMVAGMGTVIVFLLVMVVVMHATAWVFRRFAHVLAEKEQPESHLQTLVPDDSIDIAVAIAAIRHYRG